MDSYIVFLLILGALCTLGLLVFVYSLCRISAIADARTYSDPEEEGADDEPLDFMDPEPPIEVQRELSGEKRISEQMIAWAEQLDNRSWAFNRDLLYRWLVWAAPKVAKLEEQDE